MNWNHFTGPLTIPMSPLYRGGDILVYFSLLICLSVWSLCVLSIYSVSCRRSNTRHWPNVGLLLAHRLRRWANISPLLGYRVVFDATLNVGQRHRRRASINPPLVQSIVKVPPACMRPQYEVLIRNECLLASTGDAGPTFNRHWSVSDCNHRQTSRY